MTREQTKRLGRPTKAPTPGKRVALGLKVTAEIKQRIDEEARKTGRTQSQQAELIIERALANEEFLNRLLGDDQSIRTMAVLMVGALQRGGQLGANARGHPEWTSREWLTDPFALVVAGYSVMQALGIAEPHREDLPPKPTSDQIQEYGYRAFARAIAANVPIQIPPYPHPSAKSEGSK
jgi:hypothetical protein